jgi:three-Cys-motif partner protein
LPVKYRLGTYEWTKDRIIRLCERVNRWKDEEGVITPKHDVWSIKKLLILDSYIKPFVEILRSNEFRSWYYVDPFCGSGLLRLKKKHLFPGSPLIPIFKFEEFPFDGYYLSDTDKAYTSALCERIGQIPEITNANIEISEFPFQHAISKLFSGNKPEYWKSNAYLVFLDPYGFQVDWKSMELMLRSGPVDIIFTFMTSPINWNRSIKHTEKSLSSLFGSDDWRQLRSEEEFVNHYCNKITQFGYTNKYKTFSIAVEYLEGHRYDVILASQSPGAANVLRDIKKGLSHVSTDMLELFRQL